MAFEGLQVKYPGLLAGADLSAAGTQYKFVKLNSSGAVVLCSVAGERAHGVLQDTPANGAPANVSGPGITKVRAGGSITAGNYLTADPSGFAITAAALSTHSINGIALEAAGASGQLISMLQGYFGNNAP